MEPQTPTSPVTPAGGPSNLDPQIIKLADSIAKTESGGNSKATGKSGEYGAYQWMPATWQSEAQSAGINVPLDQSTPEQQNQVAYNQISKWKNEGYTPAQIASMWNTGSDPNAYLGTFKDGDPSVGTNSAGVSFDVPSYVSKVMSKYDGSTQPTPQKSSGGIDPGTAIGVGAGALGLGALATVASDGGDLLAGLGGDIGSWISGALGINDLKNKISDMTSGGTSGSGETGSTGGIGATPPPETPQGAPQDQLTPQTEEEQIAQSENLSAEQNKSALSSIANGVKSMLQGTQGGRIFSQNPDGQNTIGTAAAFNLIGQDENGNAVFDENARKNALKEVANLDDAVSASSGGSVHPLLVSNLAGNEIEKNRLMTASARQDTARIIQDEMKSDLGDVSPETKVSAARLRELAKQHNAAASQAYKEGNYTPTPKSMAHKALGQAYAGALDKALEGDPHAQELHRRAMKMESHLIRAKELKKYIHGKKIPKNNGMWETFLRQGARAAEIYIGDKLGGPVGAIIGGLIGEGLNRKITNKFGRNIFDTPGMKAAFRTLKDTKPKEYNDLVSALEKHGIHIPEDNEKPPTTMEGMAKHIEKEEKGFMGGLVKP